MIYLDYAATTPMSEKTLSVYTEVAKKYAGNPSSIHDFGSSAQKVVDSARSVIAGLVGVEPRGLYFTGSGSEANTLAIRSLVRGNRDRGNHIITTRAEHSSVRNTVQALETEGVAVSYVPLHEDGRVDLAELKSLIRPETILISIHHGNSEIGTVQDIHAIGRIADERETLFHSDAVQTFGKVPLDPQQAMLDSFSISGHKVYGPKGVGAVYISPSVRWKPEIPGTTQERGFRPGTVDTPSVAAFAAAAKEIFKRRSENRNWESKLRSYLLDRIGKLPFDITVEGGEGEMLANIVGLRIRGMEGQYAMLECNRHGLAISTGSACSVGTEKQSATMRALQRDEQESREFIRLSLGSKTTEKEIDEAIKILKSVLTEHFNMVKL